MRALVIGGTGFIGAAVVRAFERRGIDVVTLTRSGHAFAGTGVRGDVRAPDLGLEPAVAADLKATVTHVVSCFGSVDWGSGPRMATELHQLGTRAAMRFAERCERLERFVHLSSVVVLGRTTGRVVDELELGQSFRNWYEYSKFLAEREVRANDRLPWRAVRVGPVIGATEDVLPSPSHGIMAVIPALLRGYPMHLENHGSYPCYPCDGATSGEVIMRAALQDGAGDIWTWFDDTNPSLAEVFTRLCSPWGVVPKIVDMPVMWAVGKGLAKRIGIPRETLEYVKPWADIPLEVLSLLPADLPRCPPGYIEATGEALRRAHAAMRVA